MAVKIADINRVARARNREELPGLQHAEIAFAGRSNVGKSSLINSLLQRNGLVRTSNTPGCTRSVDFYEIDLGGEQKVSFVDLPGYGYAKRSKQERQAWQALIESYFESRKRYCTALLVLDARHGVVGEDEQLLEYFASIKTPCVVAATKIDKFNRAAQPLELKKLRQTLKDLGVSARDVVGYSSITHEGRDELWAAINKHTHFGNDTD